MLSYQVEIECQTDIIDVSNIGHLQCDITLGEYHNVTQPLMNVIHVT